MGRTDKLSAHGPLSVFDEALNSFENIIIRRFNVWRLFSSVMPAVFSKPRDAPHALAAATFNTFTGVCVVCTHTALHEVAQDKKLSRKLWLVCDGKSFSNENFHFVRFLVSYFLCIHIKNRMPLGGLQLCMVFFVCSQRSLSTWCRWRYRSIIYFDGSIVLLLVGSFVRWPSARMECNY